MACLGKAREHKGSKFWIQTLVNLDHGRALSKAIQTEDRSIGEIKWLSPLRSDNYGELHTKQIPGLKKADLSFWPRKGPLWDGVGVDDKGCILLVEAKAHVSETKSKCRASSGMSKNLINQSLNQTHDALSFPPHNYDEDIWLNEYYQFGNRLAFFVKLRAQGYHVKLVFLNIVDDPTHMTTRLDEWEKHYDEVFQMMLGTKTQPENLIMVNFDVG